MSRVVPASIAWLCGAWLAGNAVLTICLWQAFTHLDATLERAAFVGACLRLWHAAAWALCLVVAALLVVAMLGAWRRRRRVLTAFILVSLVLLPGLHAVSGWAMQRAGEARRAAAGEEPLFQDMHRLSTRLFVAETVVLIVLSAVSMAGTATLRMPGWTAAVERRGHG